MDIREWNLEVSRLDSFFKSNPVPKGPVKVGGFMTINDTAYFIQACLSGLTKEDNIGKDWFAGNFVRLQLLEKYMLENQ